MKRKISKIIGWVLVSMACILAVYPMAFRFKNPEMTETQLLIEFWVEYAFAIVLAVSGMFLIYLDE